MEMVKFTFEGEQYTISREMYFDLCEAIEEEYNFYYFDDVENMVRQQITQKQIQQQYREVA